MSWAMACSSLDKGDSDRDFKVTQPKRAVALSAGDRGSATKSGAIARMANTMASLVRATSSKLDNSSHHGHLGWTLSAVTADMVADAVAKGLPNAQTTTREWALA